MFQTNIIHSLQSFSSDIFTSIIILINSTGNHSFLLIALIIVVFGINFRKGIFIAQTLIWTIVLTAILKEYFSLPRPYHVDSTIQLLDSDIPNQAPFKNMGAKSFWEKLPDDIVAYYRSKKNFPYGFPSGHCSSAVSLWGSISVLFNKKWLTCGAIFFILLVAFSRIYLGYHFLIDVFGGLVLGTLILFTNYVFMRKSVLINKSSNNISNYFYASHLIIPPVILLFVTQSIYAAQILGLNLGIILLMRLNNIPNEMGSILTRFLRIGIACVLYIIISFFISSFYDFLFQKEVKILRIIRHFVTYFLMIWGSTQVFLFFGLFKREKNN